MIVDFADVRVWYIVIEVVDRGLSLLHQATNTMVWNPDNDLHS